MRNGTQEEVGESVRTPQFRWSHWILTLGAIAATAYPAYRLYQSFGSTADVFTVAPVFALYSMVFIATSILSGNRWLQSAGAGIALGPLFGLTCGAAVEVVVISMEIAA